MKFRVICSVNYLIVLMIYMFNLKLTMTCESESIIDCDIRLNNDITCSSAMAGTQAVLLCWVWNWWAQNLGLKIPSSTWSFRLLRLSEFSVWTLTNHRQHLKYMPVHTKGSEKTSVKYSSWWNSVTSVFHLGAFSVHLWWFECGHEAWKHGICQIFPARSPPINPMLHACQLYFCLVETPGIDAPIWVIGGSRGSAVGGWVGAIVFFGVYFSFCGSWYSLKVRPQWSIGKMNVSGCQVERFNVIILAIYYSANYSSVDMIFL